MTSTKEDEPTELSTGVMAAEREVAKTKLRLRESLQHASETGSHLVTEARKQATPALLVAVVVGVVIVAGVASVAARSAPARGWRAPKRLAPVRELAREAGIWLLRAAALRVVTAVAERLRDSRTPASLGAPS